METTAFDNMKIKICLIISIFLLAGSIQAQVRKGALISVYASRNLSDKPTETKMYESIMKDSLFNIEPIVARFDQLIREKFLPQFPFPFLIKGQVVNHPDYQGLAQHTRWVTEEWKTTSAPGYIPISAFGIADDEEAMRKAFSILPADVDVIMVAFIDFNLFDEMGFGGVSMKKIRVNINLKMYDRKIERVFRLKENVTSDNSVSSFKGSLIKVKDLLPLINNASDKLFIEMQEKLPKMVAKMSKRMN